MKHKLEQSILFAIVDGCSERCADATIEEESPQLETMPLEDFLSAYNLCRKKKK